MPGLPPDVPAAQVPHARIALAQLACRLYGDPARRMTMVGVTGTKGKTTVAWLLAAMLTAAGRKAGFINSAPKQAQNRPAPSPGNRPVRKSFSFLDNTTFLLFSQNPNIRFCY